MTKDRRYERPNRGEAFRTDRGKNSHRFRSMSMKREPLSPETFDMELNYLMYALNEINKGKNPLNPPINSEGKLVWIGHDSKEILYDKLTEGMVKAGGLDADKLVKNKTINNNKLANNSVDTDNLVNGCITGAKIKDATIPFNKMTGEITAENIANNTITGAKIAPSTITGAKIANGTITGGNILNATIPFSKMTGKIKTANIDKDAIETINIKDKAITNSKLSEGCVTNYNIREVDGSKIANESIRYGKIGKNEVRDDNIMSLRGSCITGSVARADRATIADNSISEQQITSLVKAEVVNNFNKLFALKGLSVGGTIAWVKAADTVTWKHEPIIRTMGTKPIPVTKHWYFGIPLK